MSDVDNRWMVSSNHPEERYYYDKRRAANGCRLVVYANGAEFFVRRWPGPGVRPVTPTAPYPIAAGPFESPEAAQSAVVLMEP